jgi:hypothetical protein
MVRQLLSDSIATSLQAEIVGHVTVGDYTLAVGSGHGICLNQATEPPLVVAQPLPLVQVPPAFARFVGRTDEVAAAIAASQTNQLIIISGPMGIGKSALLRHLAHHQQITTSRPDGILYLYCDQGSTKVADLLETISDWFYRSTPSAKFSGTAHQRLQDQQIVLLIDGNLTPANCRQITAVLPQSVCIVGTDTEWRDQTTTEITLTGLSWPASLALLEQELGPLDAAQAILAETLWQLLQGHPQRLRQAAVLAHEDDIPLSKIVKKLQTDRPDRALAQLILAGLPKTQRWIVALLVAMQGSSLTAEQIAVISGPPNPQVSLQTLLRRYLIQIEGQRYRLASSLVELLQPDFDAEPWIEQVLAHFLPWAEQQRQYPHMILAEQAVLERTLNWAVAQARWVEVLRLVRAIEAALCLGKQWQAWDQVLQWGLQAAWALSDPAAEAWALHQIGTRAACLDQVTAAYDAFSQALALRSANGDAMGSQVTQHNLDLLKRLTLPVPGNRPDQRQRFRVYLTLGVMGLLVFGLSAFVGWAIGNRLTPSSDEPTPVASPKL